MAEAAHKSETNNKRFKNVSKKENRLCGEAFLLGDFYFKEDRIVRLFTSLGCPRNVPVTFQLKELHSLYRAASAPFWVEAKICRFRPSH